MIIIVKNQRMLKINKTIKKVFSHNPIYPLPGEGLFWHVPVVTITVFPDASLISSNQKG